MLVLEILGSFIAATSTVLVSFVSFIYLSFFVDKDKFVEIVKSSYGCRNFEKKDVHFISVLTVLLVFRMATVFWSWERVLVLSLIGLVALSLGFVAYCVYLYRKNT